MVPRSDEKISDPDVYIHVISIGINHKINRYEIKINQILIIGVLFKYNNEISV